MLVTDIILDKIMEPHPIPQNVTSFQFRLVGDMTLKQFIYLAVGSVIAYVLFVFFAKDYPLVVWPLIIISASLGAAFAFLPIGSRPLDHWLGAFLKAIYTPTKRVWKKNDKTFKDDPLFGSRLVMYLSALQPVSLSYRPTPPLPPLPPQPSAPQQPTLPLQPQPPSALPSKEELEKTVDLARQAQVLQLKIIQTERILNQIRAEAQRPTSIPVDYTQQVNKVLADLQSLVSQSSDIKQKIQSITQPEQTNLPPAQTSSALKEKVKVIVPAKPKQTQLALTTFPNVLNGIIKDKNNNYLEGVVAVIYDKEGLPVRALKTNKLGQFTGSTPLPNGTYTLEFEKDNLTFDVLQIELNGQVLPPLMITPK